MEQDAAAALKGVLHAFGVTGVATSLAGGSSPAHRVGEVVLKRIKPNSLEHQRSLDLAPWIAEFSHRLPQAGFRLPKPLPTRDGQWMTADGWMAWTYLEGRHARAEDVPACIEAIVALHRALKEVPKHPLLDSNETHFGRADRACWGEKPAEVHPEVEPLVDALYALRRPVHGLEHQLIHGDLNPENVLLAPGRPPGFLDLTPFWRPVEFALAIFANWIGPRRGDASVLRHFAGVRAFDQLLIRAGIRMLLIMADFRAWESSPERRAAEIILAHLTGCNAGQARNEQVYELRAC